MTWRHLAAALVLAALPAASAAAAPSPKELWEEFPLEPPPVTTPAEAPSAPAPVAPFTPPAQAVDQSEDEESAGRGVLLWIAIAALGTVVVAAAVRRREWRPRPVVTPAAAPAEPEVEPAAAAMLERLVGRIRAATREPIVSPERSPSPTRVRAATAPAAETQEPDASMREECEIGCWPGLGFWQFHVVSQGRIVDSPLSPPFGAPGHGAPEQTDAAVLAHEVLVGKLIDAGWEQDGRGRAWFATRFRRVSA